MKPLCPYCYRSGCPYLTAYLNYPWPQVLKPKKEACPLHDAPLAPNVRKHLQKQLQRGRDNE